MGKFYFLSLVLLCLSGGNTWATHIVGGEFELVHVQDFNYRLSLVQYFDVVNGNPLAEDSSVTAFIFRKFDSQFMRSITMDKVERELVDYTQPECAIGNLRTRRLVYAQDLELPPELYDHPEGYYVVFERCCRNNVISNIFLAAPNTVGQTFYLEFPPVVQDEERFINSSPVLFQPLSDFACANELYYFDFSGIDPDGDSIVYSMSNPLNSSAVIALPTPSPAPHPVVPWNSGININNQIPGDPALNTTTLGFLSVRPARSGLFAFALKAEEFRDGIKIGEVRRDFQMLVIDCPGPNFPPKFLVRKKGQSFHDPNEVLSFSAEEDKCFELLVTDLNSHDLDPGGELVKVDLFPVNFDADIRSILSDSLGFLGQGNDTLRLEVCLPDCPFLKDEPFQIEFQASDNTCPLALMDTVVLSITVEAPQNSDPFFSEPTTTIVDTLREGESIEFDITGIDLDLDTLALSLVGQNFEVSDFGMELTITSQEPGEIKAEFSWNTGCGANNYGLFNDFRVCLILDDLDACRTGNADTIKVNLHVILPSNTDPEVTIQQDNGSISQEDREIEIDLFGQIDFAVFAQDFDLDSVELRAEGDGFDISERGMDFVSVKGKTMVESQFSWDVICEKLGVDTIDIFRVFFIATDQDTCKIPNADTLVVDFKIDVLDNSPPTLSIADLDSYALELAAGKEIKLDLVGEDPDNDSIYLRLVSYVGDLPAERFSFTSAAAIGNVSSLFTIRPDCGDLAIDSMMTLRFTFVVRDNFCVRDQTDTLELVFNFSDPIPDYEEFLPPNVFTPNGDGVNEVFFIPNLPADNCKAQMETVEIYNRWGKLVFSDDNREFVWDGQGAASGVYYYYIRYTNDIEYRGIVSVRR